MSINALTHSYNKNNAIYAFLTRVTSSFIYAFISKSEVATKATQEHLRVCLKQTRTCTHSCTHTHIHTKITLFMLSLLTRVTSSFKALLSAATKATQRAPAYVFEANSYMHPFTHSHTFIQQRYLCFPYSCMRVYRQKRSATSDTRVSTRASYKTQCLYGLCVRTPVAVCTTRVR